MAYTPTVYTDDASSPDIDATNLNKSEQGIKLAHDIAVPVDCSSREAEYTGDGIPLIPDNVAGVTTFQNEWATLDDWTVNPQSTPTPSYPGGVLKITAGASGAYILIQKVLSFTGKAFMVRMRSSIASEFRLIYTIGTDVTIVTKSSAANTWQVLNAYNAGSVTIAKIQSWATYAANDTVEIDFIYIGTGAYDTPALDRAGNGNNLTLNAVTPVNGKFYKEMSFNGVTSFGVDKSPVVGISGTLIMRWKRNRIGTAETIISNQSATTNGLRYHIDASNNLYAIIGGASPVSILIKSGFTDTASSHTFGIRFSATSATPFYDGVDGIAVSATQVLGLANFAIGRNQIDSTGYASGQGFVRYDSRIWTADEARAWSLNPISIDSRV